MTTARKHLVVHGVVQGVCFRMYTQETASRLGLLGWVRNCMDGRRVEVLVEGEPAAVDEFVNWCHGGPRLARVTRVEIEDDDGDEPLGPFTIKRTST